MRNASVLDLVAGRDAWGTAAVVGGPSSVAAADLAVSLAWATPHVAWPATLTAGRAPGRRASVFDSVSSAASVTSAASATSSSRRRASGAPSVASTRSLFGDAGPDESPSIQHGKATTTNVAVAFESPYARQYLSNALCHRAAELLAVGAYAHRFDVASRTCTYDDLFLCLEGVREFL